MTRAYEVNEDVEQPTNCPECGAEAIDGPFGMSGGMQCLVCNHQWEDEAMEWFVGEREASREIKLMVDSENPLGCPSCRNAESVVADEDYRNVLCTQCGYVDRLTGDFSYEGGEIIDTSDWYLEFRTDDRTIRYMVMYDGNASYPYQVCSFWEADTEWNDGVLEPQEDTHHGYFESNGGAIAYVLEQLGICEDGYADPIPREHVPEP